jgi:hypothetical protein
VGYLIQPKKSSNSVTQSIKSSKTVQQNLSIIAIFLTFCIALIWTKLLILSLRIPRTISHLINSFNVYNVVSQNRPRLTRLAHTALQLKTRKRKYKEVEISVVLANNQVVVCNKTSPSQGALYLLTNSRQLIAKAPTKGKTNK